MRWQAVAFGVVLSLSIAQAEEPPPWRIIPPASPTEKELLGRLRKVLPEGWAAQYTTHDGKDHFLEFKRLRATPVESTIPNGPQDEEPTRETMSFDLQVLPLLPVDAYRNLSRENRGKQRRMDTLYRALSHGGLAPSQSGDFLWPTHKLTNEDRRNIAEYRQLQNELHHLPEFYFRNISLDWTTNENGGFYPYAPVEDAVLTECREAIKKIEAVLSKY